MRDDPARRWAGALDVDEPGDAGPSPAWLWMWQHKVLTTVAGLVVLLLVGALVPGSGQSPRPRGGAPTRSAAALSPAPAGSSHGRQPDRRTDPGTPSSGNGAAGTQGGTATGVPAGGATAGGAVHGSPGSGPAVGGAVPGGPAVGGPGQGVTGAPVTAPAPQLPSATATSPGGATAPPSPPAPGDPPPGSPTFAIPLPTQPVVYYATCVEAVLAGVAPLARGEPGYRLALDPDGDGIACETASPPPGAGSSGGSGGPTVPPTARPTGPPIVIPIGGPSGDSGGSAHLDPRFGSCAEATAQGFGPYHRGRDPEYGWYPDRDRDGVVCA